jgi:S1-C subfamily serine protease
MGDKSELETFCTVKNQAFLEIDMNAKYPSGKNRKSNFLKLYPSNIISSINPVSKGLSESKSWKGNGSGIIISKDGYFVTNNHVVENMNDFEVEFKYAKEIRSFHAKLVKTDPTNDLAILKIDDPNFKNLNSIPYNFYSRSAVMGTEVFALGYPLAHVMGKDIKFTDGKISSKTGYMGDITCYQTTTPIQPGNSGGPLFDHNANLLGINSSGLRKDVAENVSYTIKTNYLINLIDVLPKTIPLPSSTWIASKPLTDQIRILSNYVVLIKVR